LQLRVLLCDLYGVTRETRAQVVQGQKGVIEVQGGDLIRHFGVMGTAWVTVAEDDVVQPVWDDTLCVHQVPDRLQDGLQESQRNEERQTRQASLKRRSIWMRIALWWADGTAGHLYVCQLYFNELQTV